MPENKDIKLPMNTSENPPTTGALARSVSLPATGVVFAGRNGLDFLELRLGAVRIPEVSLRIREAQRILDSLDVERIDLLGATITEDESFFRNIKIKSLLAAIVQVGLYDRLMKTQRLPDVLVGSSNGDSALLVCAGQMTFESMVKNSAALKTLSPLTKRDDSNLAPGISSVPSQGGPSLGLLPGFQAPLCGGTANTSAEADRAATRETLSIVATSSLPSLSGVCLTEFRAFIRSEDGGMIEVGQPVMDIKRLMTEVVEHQGVARFINVGPGLALPVSEYEVMAEAAGTDEVTVIDSIDLDPMLNWFWRQMRPLVGYAQ